MLFRSSATMYKDVAGYPTIGYGTLIDEPSEQYLMTAVISREEAEDLLLKEMSSMLRTMNILLAGLKLTQNQFDALCSFVYNLGTGALKSSTLLKKVKANPNDPTIRKEFMKWVNAGGKKVQGLVNRRNDEANLYFS